MRTGAIFARGSCRALKWMALFGVVFALGVGSAMAQDEGEELTLEIESVEIAGSTDDAVSVMENTVVDVEVTLSAKVPDAQGDSGEENPQETSVDLFVSATGIEVVNNPMMGMAEVGDVQIDGDDFMNAGNRALRMWEEGDETVTFQIELDHDRDAVDEKFTLMFALVNVQRDGSATTEGQTDITLDDETTSVVVTVTDDETQTYEFDVTDADENVKEGTAINVELELNPARPAMEDVKLHVFVDDDMYDVRKGSWISRRPPPTAPLSSLST